MRNKLVFSRQAMSAILALAVSLALAAFPTTAQAYVKLSCHQPSSYSTFAKTSYVTGTYATALTSAANDWTVSRSPVVLAPGNSTSQFYVDAYFYGNTGYDGIQSSSGCSGGHWLTPYASWNTYYTDTYTVTNKRQVMVHEIGHVLGLAHSGPSSCAGQPIMYFSGTRYTICGHVVPQPDDAAGVSSIY